MRIAPVAAALAVGLGLGLVPARAVAQRPVPVPSQIPIPPGGPPDAAALDADDRVWTPASGGLRESRVTAIAASPSDPKHVVAATSRGAVYVTEDGGRNWTQTLRIPLLAREREDRGDAGALAEDAEAGTPDPDGLSEEDLLELEELREETFQDVLDELTEIVGEDEAERIAEEEADEAVTERREELIERAEETADAVVTETDDEDAPPARLAVVRQVVWDPTFPGLVYLATHDGVWRSGDGGGNWVQLEAGVGAGERDVVSVAPSAGNPDRILIGTGAGVLASDDGGLTFADAEGELGSTEVRTIAIDPEARSVVGVGTVAGAFLSTDGGASWRKVWSGIGAQGDVRALAFRRGDEAGLLVGTADGLYIVTPDGSAALGVAAFASAAIRSVVAPRGDTSHVYVATSRSVHESLDGGRTFAELYRGLATPDVIVLAEEHSNPDSVWAGTALGVYRLLPQGIMAAVTGHVGGPSIVELLRAAQEYHYLDVETLRGWQRNARYARLVPRVRAVWRRDYDRNVDIDVDEIRDSSGVLVSRTRFPSGFDHNVNEAFYVTLTWRFDEVLFGSERARVISLTRTLTARRARHLAEVTRLARERRDLAGQLAATPPGSSQRLTLELRFQELTAYLDGLTGGALSGYRGPSRARAAPATFRKPASTPPKRPPSKEVR